MQSLIWGWYGVHALIISDLDVNKVAGIQSPKQNAGTFFAWQHTEGVLLGLSRDGASATKCDKNI